MKIVLKILTIIIGYALCCAYMFYSHYEYHGDTVSICYYTPFDFQDYILICLLTAAAIATTYYFCLRHLRKRVFHFILCTTFYVVAAFWQIIFNVPILKYPTENWPYEYHPLPIHHSNVIRNNTI